MRVLRPHTFPLVSAHWTSVAGFGRSPTRAPAKTELGLAAPCNIAGRANRYDPVVKVIYAVADPAWAA